MTDIEKRIRALEEIEAIKRLKYRYWRCLDLKLWDELAGTFTDDATVAYGDGKYRFEGVAAVMKFLRDSLSTETGSVTIHHGHHPEIDLTGDATARGTWALYNYLFNEKRKRGVWIGAFYHDDYAKVGGEWRQKHVGYETIFHQEWSFDDLPSLTSMKR